MFLYTQTAMKAMPDEAETQEKKGLILETYSDVIPLCKSQLHFFVIAAEVKLLYGSIAEN